MMLSAFVLVNVVETPFNIMEASTGWFGSFLVNFDILRGVSMIEGVTDWRKEKRKLSRKLDLRKLKIKRSLSCFFLNFSKSGV